MSLHVTFIYPQVTLVANVKAKLTFVTSFVTRVCVTVLLFISAKMQPNALLGEFVFKPFHSERFFQAVFTFSLNLISLT